MNTPYTNEIFFTLIVGSYLFTAWVFRYFSTKLEKLVANHLHAMATQIATIVTTAAAAAIQAKLTEARVEKLEHTDGKL